MKGEVSFEMIARFDTYDEDLELEVTIDGDEVNAIKGEDGRFYYGVSVDTVREEAGNEAGRIVGAFDRR